MKRLSYLNQTDKALQLSINQKLGHYFALRSRKGNAAYWLKNAFFVFLSLASYLGILFLPLPFTGVVALSALMGWAIGALLLSLGHDASHNACSKYPAVNRLLSYTWDMFGISHYVWELKHNQSHHAYTNVPEWDWDLATTPLIRFSPLSPKKWFHAYQYLYAGILYSMLALFTVYIRDFQFLFFAKIGKEKAQKHAHTKILSLVVCKVFFFIYSFLIPMYCLKVSVGEMIVIHLSMLLTAGSFIAFVLVPAHINDICAMPVPNEAHEITHSWYKHHFETSVDFAANSRIINWITGATNTHLAHHLFPSICHIHYFEVTKLLKEVAEEHNIPYHNLSIWELYKSHFRHLKKMGNAA